MSARLNVFLSVGLIVLMLLTIGVGGYYIKRANDAVDETKRLILEGRQIGNMRGNATLGAVSEVLTDIKAIETELRDNLTQHRIVANDTNRDLHILISQFNQTNEQGRSVAVDQIITEVNKNTESLLQKYLGSFDSSGSIASSN